jgi:hypothetical protein
MSRRSEREEDLSRLWTPSVVPPSGRIVCVELGRWAGTGADHLLDL